MPPEIISRVLLVEESVLVFLEVSDPDNYGAVGSLWAYFCETEAGATFVARGTTYHTTQLVDLIGKGILHKGFSVIDVISQCPESYGRLNPNRMGKTGSQMMKWMRDNVVSVEQAKKAAPEEVQNKIVIGIFVDREAPEFTSEYQKLVKRIQLEMK